MQNRYFKLIIPFGTKSYINRKNKKLVATGNAIFIFDKNTHKYVDEYLEIKKGNFRLTDKAMIKPTDYYKNIKIKNFRDNVLDTFSSIDHNTISKETFKELNEEQINIINLEFKKMENTTIKTMYSMLSGSNISGSETNHKASPILCIDGEYSGCNFANLLKKYESNKKLKCKKNWDNLVSYSIKDILNKKIYIEKFDYWFHEYNEDYIYKDNLEIQNIEMDCNEKYNYVEIKKNINEFKISEKQLFFIKSYLDGTIENIESINDKILKNRLRGFYNQNILHCLRKGMLPSHSTVLKNNLSQIHNAHIFDFSSLINSKNYNNFKMAIDPYNCLRIDATYHLLWDKNEIEFDKFGNIIKNNEIIIEKYLNLNVFPNKTKLYFKKYIQQNNRKIKL